jgi:ribonuclease HIII
MVVFKNVTKDDVAKLLKKGFKMETPKTLYEDLRLQRKGVSVIYYTSGKLFLQGKKHVVTEVADEIRSYHLGEEERKTTFRRESGVIIGSDETLKGDTFGGLVVAAVKADNKIRQELMDLGVADSKKLADVEILRMADKIRKICPCQIISLLPEEYNHFTGLTGLLDKLHRDAAKFLQPGKHVVDKYPGCKVGDIQEEKAESKYVEVAAASVLARATGLKQLDYLSSIAGFDLPKGSTHVKDALQRLKDNNIDFSKFTKLHFRNVKEFL